MSRAKPCGNALLEYLMAIAGVAVIWLAFERSPAGLGQAFANLVSSYSFFLSLPW